ncbi:MAG: aminotransferase class I/II-fold pyridoxal phosphate-dependent enzyme [Emcibacteraceae bacterium]|nr:aminotransferase class I/II-fold pyridoxal phosphate-dependent enzyme [Emcibacteraceae bacterium]
MKKIFETSRRKFMKTVGLSALVSAASGSGAIAMGQSSGPSGKGYDFDEVYPRINSRKWEGAYNTYGRDNIDVAMGTADLDFKQVPAVVRALKERVEYENYGYEATPDSFYQAIIDWNKDRYDQTIKKEWIKTSSALKPGMVSSMRGLNPVKGKVILLTPTYSGFRGAINKAGMTVVMSPMKRVNDRWAFDLEDLESKLDYETKCVVLCNPNNPTGEFWGADEMRALGDICIKHGVTVLSDEIHCDFPNKGSKFIPYASLGEKYANSSITYRSPSKTFGHACLRVAYFFTQNEDLMNATMAGGGHEQGVNTFGVLAAETAFREGAEWIDDLNIYLDESFDYIDEFVNRSGEMPGVKFSKPDGLYLAWFDCNGLKEKVASPEQVRALHDKWRDEGNHRPVTPEMCMQEWIARNVRIHILPGSSYGIGAEGFMRMNIGVSRTMVKMAMENWNKALKTLG